jgi:hypothetical protein
MKQKNPPVDIRKVLRAAAEAALEEPAPPVRPKKRRLSTGRALLLGAGAVTAGRILTRRGEGLLPSLRDRVADLGAQPDDEAEEPDLEAEEDVEALEEEPDAEPEEELDEEPQSNGGEPEKRPRQRTGRGRS